MDVQCSPHRLGIRFAPAHRLQCARCMSNSLQAFPQRRLSWQAKQALHPRPLPRCPTGLSGPAFSARYS